MLTTERRRSRVTIRPRRRKVVSADAAVAVLTPAEDAISRTEGTASPGASILVRMAASMVVARPRALGSANCSSTDGPAVL